MPHSVHIRSVMKRYGDFIAIPELSLEIKEGEFFTLLGPSGCGKTTLLRMIAGFNEIDGGEISFDDRVINDLPAHKRDIGMVFQNYAIFPHLTVKENVAYGLIARKVPAAEKEERTQKAMELMHIAEHSAKYPQQLSGGQQQRVALARAVVIEPSVLLMDEPLSNLDAKLRVEMRLVIREVQQKLGITTVYVTHDQEEALSVSDRIAVMNKGHVAQLGTPLDIYLRPANTFVADFIGITSFIPVQVDAEGKVAILGKAPLGIRAAKSYTGMAILAVRPENVVLKDAEGSDFTGRISTATFLGDSVCYEIDVEGGRRITANQYMINTDSPREVGQTVGIGFLEKRLNLFDPSGEESLL
ncbi:ABC transporter ATP-binding protein [Desulfovibrio sp. OttesenSCG-928-I05]|nr:ABC transporter ATP-binding protein [Desulfovibrio sp. OttesenSCG-928-I05]